MTDPVAAFRQRRPQRRETTLSVHRAPLAFPDLTEIGRASQRAWERLCGVPLSQAASGREPLWLSADGDGVWLAHENFGAFSGDGVNTIVHLLLPDDIHAAVTFGMDYSQRELPMIACGPRGADLEAALDALGAMAFRLRCKPQR